MQGVKNIGLLKDDGTLKTEDEFLANPSNRYAHYVRY